jgi:hypothetical protein
MAIGECTMKIFEEFENKGHLDSYMETMGVPSETRKRIYDLLPSWQGSTGPVILGIRSAKIFYPEVTDDIARDIEQAIVIVKAALRNAPQEICICGEILTSEDGWGGHYNTVGGVCCPHKGNTCGYHN